MAPSSRPFSFGRHFLVRVLVPAEPASARQSSSCELAFGGDTSHARARPEDSTRDELLPINQSSAVLLVQLV